MIKSRFHFHETPGIMLLNFEVLIIEHAVPITVFVFWPHQINVEVNVEIDVWVLELGEKGAGLSAWRLPIFKRDVLHFANLIISATPENTNTRFFARCDIVGIQSGWVVGGFVSKIIRELFCWLEKNNVFSSFMFRVFMTPRLQIETIYGINKIDDVCAALCLLLFLCFEQNHRPYFQTFFFHLVLHVWEKLSCLNDAENWFGSNFFSELSMSFLVNFIKFPCEFANRTVELVF